MALMHNLKLVEKSRKNYYYANILRVAIELLFGIMVIFFHMVGPSDFIIEEYHKIEKSNLPLEILYCFWMVFKIHVLLVLRQYVKDPLNEIF